ncbi:hypothetical protein JOF42_002405 [Microbacterium phyllosphaerae]|uniref:Uncharacterized protein n=1 Tax=Microbacterium phyllosphaerae TaxID=124798 RepID=A0ABS4WRU5_9MICO|nr:hypothetical protein [Microbacterium phyllosphaerae]
MPRPGPQTLPAEGHWGTGAYALSETRRKPGISTATAWLH